MSAVLTPSAVGGIDHWREAFRTQASSLPFAGTSWLDAVRRRALERFAATGWPSNRLENWRHTSLVFLDAEHYAPAPRGGSADQAGLRALVEDLRADDDGHWLVFVDGRAVPALSRPVGLPAGVEIAAWSQASVQGPAGDALQALFDDESIDIVEAPAALNAAFAGDGALIRIGAGISVAAPIHLVFVTVSQGSATHVRNLIAAEAGAQATVVEHYLGFGEAAEGASLTNVVTRINAAADAAITHVKLQQESAAAVHLASIDALQARGSRFDSHSLSFGARLARNDIGTRMDGDDCSVLLNGLYHVDGRRHVDHHTRIHHARPRGSSREFYRGMLDDQSRGVFTGRIVVAPGAMRTDAIQRTDSLLLSARAETDARPELEIYADDVKCAHGATVGQIDEAALFYLRTRGLDEAHARNVLTYAFAAQALQRIDVPSLRRRASAAIRSRLPGAAAIDSMEARP